MHSFTINYFNGQTESFGADEMVCQTHAYVFMNNEDAITITVPIHTIRSVSQTLNMKKINNKSNEGNNNNEQNKRE